MDSEEYRAADAATARRRRRPAAGLVLAALVVVVLAGIGLWVLALTRGWFEVPPEQLEARYRLPNSQFVMLDGVRVHFVDEGTGPPVVLLHASFMSLRTWDALAESLAPRWRVIRFDRIGLGLTGEDPTGQYTRERDMQLLDALLERLGVDQFALVGTSSGGGVAFHYAAARPERVTRLALVNSGGLPRTSVTDPNRPRGDAVTRWVQQRHRSQAFWRGSLETQFASGRPPDALVRQVYDLNRRSGQRAIARASQGNFRTGRPQEVLARVTAPTLVVWGLDNVTLSHLEADVFQHWLVNAPSAVLKYADAGHYLYLEHPQQFARDLESFLAGEVPLRPAVAPLLDAANRARPAPGQAEGRNDGQNDGQNDGRNDGQGDVHRGGLGAVPGYGAPAAQPQPVAEPPIGAAPDVPPAGE